MDREDFNKVKSPMTKTIIRMLAGKDLTIGQAQEVMNEVAEWLSSQPLKKEGYVTIPEEEYRTLNLLALDGRKELLERIRGEDHAIPSSGNGKL